MAVISGTIREVVNLSAPLNTGRKAYLVTADFGAYVTGTDTMALNGVGAAIAAKTRSGRTVTLRGALPGLPGKDIATMSVDVYAAGAAVQALTVTGDNLTGILANAAGAGQSSTACRGVGLLVIVDEA